MGLFFMLDLMIICDMLFWVSHFRGFLLIYFVTLTFLFGFYLMTAARRKERLRRSVLLLLAIFAVVLINGYAFYELIQVAGNRKISMLPGSFSVQLMRLAVILAVNCLVILYLLLSRGRKWF